MENLLKIINEIKEKKGREWIGLKESTEEQLDTLKRYLEHPEVQKNLKLVEEVVKAYSVAKDSGFIRIEGIVRKLDELNIKYGKAVISAEMEKEDLEIKEEVHKRGPHICKSCGNENRISAKFCDNCGKKLES